MGKGSSGPSQTVVQAQQIPKYITQGGQRLFSQAENLAQQPYQTYSQPRIADLSTNQKQAIYQAGAGAGAFQPHLDRASELVEFGSTPLSGGALDKYINPYTERVIDIAAGKVGEQFDRDRINLQSQATAAGALGGARHGVLEGEMRERRNETIGDLYLKGLQGAYDNAQGAFNQDRSAAFTGAGALGNIAQQQTGLGTQDLSNLLGTGELARSLPQGSLDLAYQDFLNQQNYPWQQLNSAMGILSGTPYESKSTQTTSASNTGGSTAGQALGTVASLAGIAGMFMSDRRTKKNIRKVGALDNDLPVYAFKYKHGGPTQIGVMAQDVEKVKPEAVGALDGIKLVNYDMAVAA